MALVKYDAKFVPNAFGLVNIGATCYFNSFIQAMLSLPSVTAFFLENEERLKSNPVATTYIRFLRHVLSIKNSESVNPLELFRMFVIAIRKKNPHSTFGSGQEDADEALTLFLDSIDDPDLYKIFMSTYNLSVFCSDCTVSSRIKSDNSCVIEITPGASAEILPISEKIKRYTVTCPGYKCPKCERSNRESPPQTLYRLCNVGNVITILFLKYNIAGAISYQQTIELPGNDGVLTFKLVAIIEHSGSTSGGHYWSRCLRTGGFALLNDSSVGQGDDSVRSESYILFYHYI